MTHFQILSLLRALFRLLLGGLHQLVFNIFNSVTLTAFLTSSSVLFLARARDESFSVFDSFSDLISGLRQVLQRQVSHVVWLGHLIFDGIFFANEEKQQVVPFSEQNLMYEVYRRHSIPS